MKIKSYISLALVFILILVLVGCGDGSEGIEESEKVEEDLTLLVYSGAGLKKPMTKIAKVFEEEHGIKIDYVFAGSTQLLSQIELSAKGDVFIVGSHKAYDISKEKDLTLPAKQVAYHNPIIGVPKGNPANISSLEDLANPGVEVILGDEKANAIGETSQKIIEETGLDAINENVVSKTATVNELVVHLDSKNADAAIITEDAAFQNENIETIEIPEEINIKQIIPVGVLKESKYLDEANLFVDFISSDRGKEIFNEYGFPPVE